MQYSCTIRWTNVYVVPQCVQTLVITSERVRWEKQGTCILVDNEPAPPTNGVYASHNGWKEVKGIITSMGGADFLFPADQLMLVVPGPSPGQATYKPIGPEKGRMLGSLKNEKHYLMWYHHLLQEETWKQKKNAR